MKEWNIKKYMGEIELEKINFDIFKKDVYKYYNEIFPENEKKPLDMLQNSYENNYEKFTKIAYKNEFVGFILTTKTEKNGYEILDYYAILPEYRNKGIGSKALEKYIKEEKDNSKGIFVEVEKVGLGKDENENQIREKRKNFYDKLGFKKLNYDFVLFDVTYSTHIYTKYEIDEDEIVDEIFKIYETFSGKKRIEDTCKRIKLI